MFSMVTTISSRLVMSMLDMEDSLLRLACWEILRLPGLFGLLRTFPPPDNWVNTPGVERDRGRDILFDHPAPAEINNNHRGTDCAGEILQEDMRKWLRSWPAARLRF